MKSMITLMFISVTIACWSQAYVPPSPDALGLAKFSNTPVNYYTGTPVITVPLTQLSGKELSVPISLSYNASGFKVQEVAGSVGLGWSLNAGGVITRVVRGLPDELADGYCGVNNRGEQAAGAAFPSTYTDNVAIGQWDGEPDLFYYNFLGRSGKFILDAQGKPFCIPFTEIQIKPAICAAGSSGEWTIVDENGVTYKFGTTSSARESTTSRLATQTTAQQRTYVTSWYLTEIANPNRTDVITINYSSSTVNYKNYFFTKIEDSSPCNSTVNNLKDESTIITVGTKYPSYISSSLGNISFSWSSGRQDIVGGYYLSSITISNNLGQVLHKNRFEYSYFESSSGCGTELCRRLRLDKVYDLAPDPIASFTYETTVNLPQRDSKNFDHWGYYNNNTVDSWLGASSLSDIVFPEYNHDFSGALRESDPEKTKANILTRIDSRGGAFQIFNFDAHSVCNGYPSSGTCDGNVIIGGVRISSIVQNDGAGNTITRNFSYVRENSTISSGFVYYRPSYYAFKINQNPTWKRFSHALTSTFDINGAHVGYSRVEESVIGGGKTIYTFTNFDANPDGGDLFELWGPNYVPASSEAWERGNVDEVRFYDNNGYLLVRQDNTYNNDIADKRNIKAWAALNKTYECSSYLDYTAHSYNIMSRPFTITKQVTETYEPGTSRKLTSVLDYFYDPITYQLTETKQYDLNRPTIKYVTKNKFASHPDYFASPDDNCMQALQICELQCDYTSDPSTQPQCYSDCQTAYTNCMNSPPSNMDWRSLGVYKMMEKHQIAVPIETQALHENGSAITLLSSQLNMFQSEGPSGAHLNLKEVWNMNKPLALSSYTPSKIPSTGIFQFDQANLRRVASGFVYDQTNSNLVQQTSFDGIQTTFTWGHNNSIVTATSKTGGVNSRSASATYKPLVGELSATDPNGRVSYTEYDGYNRPFIAKDHDGNILGRTTYHYKGETPGFRINTNRVEALINETFSFSVVDIAISVGGTPQFVWDFGDGTVVENVTSYFKTYATAGQYTVKLVGLNPDFGPATRTLQVNAYQPMSLSACIDGPVSVDLCGNNSPYYGSCTTTPDPSDPVVITVKRTGGCASSFSFLWQYKKTTDTDWTTLSSATNTATFYPGAEGTWEVRCTVTDGCSNTAVSTSTISRYKSDPNCSY